MPLSPLLIACLAATWLIWGSTYLAIKFALESFPPFFQMGSRFLVAGSLLLIWLKLRGRPLPTRVEWRNAAIIGTLLLVSGMGFTAYAEVTVASGLVVAGCMGSSDTAEGSSQVSTLKIRRPKT